MQKFGSKLRVLWAMWKYEFEIFIEGCIIGRQTFSLGAIERKRISYRHVFK